MRLYLQIIVFAFCGYVHGQIRPVISIAYSQHLFEPWANVYQFGVGMSTNKNIITSINYSYVEYFSIDKGSSLQAMKNGLLSLALNYRVLNEDQIVSPCFVFDVGIPIHSNADSSLMESHYMMTSEYSKGVWRYNRGLFNGKVKAMFDFKIRSFNLLLGMSYNVFLCDVSWYTKPANYYKGELAKRLSGHTNFGFETSLMYTLPRKSD